MTGLAWVDGRIVREDAPHLLVGDRGVTLGDGLFETIRIEAGRPVDLEAHLARLADGRRVLGIAGVPADDALAAAVAALIAAADCREGAARLTVTRGPGPRGLAPPASPHPTVIVTTSPGAAPQSAVRLMVSRTTRRNEWSPLSRIKSTNALDAVLARCEAAASGCDDAVMLNSRGRVAEATAANLFLRIGGALLTPPVEEGALPGIMRARVLALTGAVLRPIGEVELRDAEEIVLTSALSVRAVHALVTARGTRALAVETAASLRAALGLAAA